MPGVILVGDSKHIAKNQTMSVWAECDVEVSGPVYCLYIPKSIYLSDLTLQVHIFFL